MRARHIGVTIAVAALIFGAAIASAAQRDGGCMHGKGMRGSGMGEAGMHGARMRGEGMHRAGMRGGLGPIGWALEQLDLTAEQQTQIDKIREEAHPGLQALHEKLRASEEAFRAANPITTFDESAIRAHVAARAAIQADLEVSTAKVRTKMLAVLTAEQLAKLQQTLAEEHDMPGPGGPPPGR